MARQCCFCPKNADSQEHVWSQWILDLLPEAGDGTFTRRFRNGIVKTWPISKPVLTSGVVCAANCNNGWMSDKLENPMKAITSDIILQNKESNFSTKQCATIASWAFKTTVLANHIEATGAPFFSERERFAFARDLRIPEGVHVWIARRNAGHLHATFRSTRREMQPANTPLMPHLKKAPNSPYRFEIYDCTFSVGYLLLQLVAGKWARPEHAKATFPPIIQGKFYEQYSFPIWPNNGFSVQWPPPKAVGNDLIEAFVDRFDKFNLPPRMDR